MFFIYMKYHLDKLKEIFEKEGRILPKKYQELNINRDLKIEGHCKTEDCENIFSKTFKSLVKGTGGFYCRDCVKKNTEPSRLVGIRKALDKKELKYTAKSLIECFKSKGLLNLKEISYPVQLERRSKIIFPCQANDCENQGTKMFQTLLKKDSLLYCRSCTRKNSHSERIAQGPNIKKNLQWKSKLKNIGVILSEEYNNIQLSRDTIIEQPCSNKECKGIFTKTIRDLIEKPGGPYCKECILNKTRDLRSEKQEKR